MHRRKGSLATVTTGLLALTLLFGSARPAQAVANAPFNVTSLIYGANGSDAFDDTAGIQNAINAVPASGGEVYIPAGVYYLSAPLTISNKPISFRGEGQRITTLIRSGLGDGIVFTSSGSINQGFAVRSLSLLRSDAGGGVAIKAWWPTPASYAALGPITATINDVHISTNPWPVNAGQWWKTGIELTNATNAKIYVFNIHMGGMGAHSPDVESGIDIRGASTGVQITDGDVSEMNRGITVREQSSAVFIKDVETGAVEYGFHLLNAGTGSTITNCHSFGINAIRVENTSDVTVSHNLLFTWPGWEANAIKIVNPSTAGARFRIIDNTIFPQGTTNPFGIVVEGTSVESVIQGNYTYTMAVGIWLRDASLNSYIVSGNFNWAPAIAGYLNSSTGTLSVDNH